MRNQLFALVVFCATLCGQGPTAASTPADQAEQQPSPEAGWHTGTTIETGAAIRTVDGEKSFGFQQYREIPRGGFLRQFDFSVAQEGNPFRFDFRSVDLLQRDQTATGVFENWGRYRFTADLWGFQRFWSNHNPSVLTEARRGVFVAPDALRGTLESVQNPIDVARNSVLSAPQVEIRSWRQRGTFAYTHQFGGGLTANVRYMLERRAGSRLFSQGTYSRIATPQGDTFETPGQELWEPTAYRNQEFAAELNYGRGNWFVGGSYRASLFTNHDLSLTWQNPFQLTHQQATPPAGALLRGRFAASQAALPPDNQAHTIAFNAMVLLPAQSKVSALVSWSRWTQDQKFLPYTINSAITAGNLGGETPASAALPRPSLGGVIHTLTQDYVATTRPWSPLRLTLRYSDYDLDNDTEEILFPGYAAFGDSFWRTEITGQPGTAAIPIQSEPKSFRRQRLHVESAIRFLEDVTWKVAYRYERTGREHRQADVVNEHGVLTSISWAPKNNWFGQAGFRYFERKPELYDPGTLEPSFLRMFDQAERRRITGNFLAGVNLTQSWLVSASWMYMGDRYDKEFFGLHQVKANSVAADLTWAGVENFGAFIGWGYDRTGYDYLAVSKIGPAAAPYDFANSWTRDTRDGIHEAHIGLSGAAHGGRLNYQVNYALALARTEINTANPRQVLPSAVLNARADPWPTVKSQFHELRLDGSYEITRRVRIGAFWLLEPYRLNDFANDTIAPYAPERIAPENDATRFMFLDTGSSNYTGNMAALYIRLTLF